MADLFTGEMTWRELRTFTQQAPRESAFCRSLHGELVEWGVAENLQAITINDQRLFNSGKRQLPKSQMVGPPVRARAEANGQTKPGTAEDLDKLFSGG